MTGMATRIKSDRAVEYGDFQTPAHLARGVCRLLASLIQPATIIEPTCGVGSFLLASLDAFPGARRIIGLDVNPHYIEELQANLRSRSHAGSVQTIVGDFFSVDWPALLNNLPDPLLIVGNPPWVTNTELCTLNSSNLPAKTNFKKHVGLDAVTGKSNFDISEWMLLKFLEWMKGRNATLAMLCKTAVARKVLLHGWKHNLGLSNASMYEIDAETSFGVSVDACLLVCRFSTSSSCAESAIYSNVTDQKPARILAYRDGQLVADLEAYERWKSLRGTGPYRWRSGIKHDCTKIMELRREGRFYRNGLRELIDLEDEYLYPMFKGSEIANRRIEAPKRWMLVPQRRIGEETTIIRERAPKTWEYLTSHATYLERRGSSIYQNRPRFSIFGVGDYSFAPWKVVVCGLYKRMEFAVIGGFAGKPAMVDDTCYFAPCDTEQEARYVASLLHSSPAQEFLSALIFWDSKRPITVDCLRQLNLLALARALDPEERIPKSFFAEATPGVDNSSESAVQRNLFDRD